MVKTGTAWAGTFVTLDSTGALATPSTGPAGALYVDGTANAAAVTITGSNPYKWSVTLPSLTAGQRVDMYITATISTIETAGFVASEQADTALLSDGVVVNSGTVTTLTNLPAAPTDWLTGAAVKADAVSKLQANLALEATLTAIKGAGWSTETLKEIYSNVVEGFDGQTVEAAMNAVFGDTGTYLAAIKADIDNGGRLDLLIDAIKAKTDTIVALTAQTVWEYATRVLTAGTNIDLSSLATATMLTDLHDTDIPAIKAETAAIKAKTDNLPADPADDSDIDSQLAAIKAVVDNVHDTDLPAVKAETASILEDTGTTLDGIVDAIKVKTDQLTFTTANKVDATATATIDASTLTSISGNVWAHPIRTLTNQGIEATTPASGDPLEVYRDTTISFTLTGLAGMTGYTKIWFTVKEDLEDLDTAAVLQIATTDGLKYLDGSATVTDGDGTLVPDVNAGTAVIKLQQASAALLPVYAAYPIPWDLKMLNAGIVSRLAEGQMYIKSTPTRSIS